MHAKSVARDSEHTLIVESTFEVDKFAHHTSAIHLLEGKALAAFTPAKKRSNTKRHKLFWCVSIAVHLLILVLIARFGIMHKRSEESSPVLKSYLIVPLNTAPLNTVPVNPPQTTNLNSEPTALIELESEDPVIKPPPDLALDLDPRPDLQNKTSDIINEPEQAAESPELIAPENTDANRVFTNKQVDTSMSERLRRALLKQANESAVQALSNEAAKQYQKAKLSPEINTETSVNTWEIPDQAPKTEVDCTNAVKQGLAILSMLAHGTIQCSDNANFQEYIDKRIEKKP